MINKNWLTVKYKIKTFNMEMQGVVVNLVEIKPYYKPIIFLDYLSDGRI